MLFVGCLVVGLRPSQPSRAQAGFLVGEPLAGLRWDDAVGVLGPQPANLREKVDQRELKALVRSLRRQLKARSERLGGSVRAPSATRWLEKRRTTTKDEPSLES